MGVEAAAKWLRGLPVNVRGSFLADAMLAAIGDDPEGTEARTVAQIVQYMRETAFGQKGQDVVNIKRMAESIQSGEWKRR